MEEKKKRGRKPKNTKTEKPTSLPKPGVPGKKISAMDFESFVSEVKSEPRKSDESSEQMSLMLKINKLKLEIQNLKDFQQIQALWRTNNQLQMEVLKLRHDILISEPPFAAPSPENKFIKQTTVTTNVDKAVNNDSINIRNVIYNNCDQNFVIKQKESPKPQMKQTTDRNFEENFPSVASTILSYLSDKQDVETHTVALKQYTYELLKNEYNKLKSESDSVPFPMNIKSEKSEEMSAFQQQKEVSKVINVRKIDTLLETAIRSPVRAEMPVPQMETVPVKVEAPETEPDTPQPSMEDLHFSYIEIKPKIIEYLSDKVDKDTIVSAVRRLTKTKSKSLMRQPFEEHTKLLRVYLFQDKNILVQDMIKCQTEFARDTYHSVRYYAVSLTKRTQVKVFPTKVTKGITNYHNQNTDDYVILQPLRDSVCRPKFRVDTIQDMMISEEFEFVSHNPFIIRPLFTDVVITSTQLNLLKPLVLQALANKSLSFTNMPVISISNNIHENEEFDDFPKAKDSGPQNLFRITNQETSETNPYGLAEVKSDRNVIDLTENENSLKRKMEPSLTTSSPKKTKNCNVQSAGNTAIGFAIVNVDDIFKKAMRDDDGNSPCLCNTTSSERAKPCIVNQKETSSAQETNLKHIEIETKYELNFSIDLDDSEEDDSIIIH